MIINGMFWVLLSGAPWRDLPERYGPWKTVYNRFNRWSKSGMINIIFNRLLTLLDANGLIDWSATALDGSNIRALKCAAGAQKNKLISDQYSGINDIVVPRTLRDSLVILAVVLEQQTDQMPYQIMTDTGAYSDVIFGLFRLLGYRFCPRIADTGGARFWRTDPKADYGPFNAISSHRLNFGKKTEPHWDDILRLIASLKLGRLNVMSIMKTLQTGDRPTSLAQAIAEIGRADKTIHMLTYLDDENKRRRTLQQLNRGEGRHAVARNVFHGKRGELRQAYREGQEDQLGSLGLVLNIIVQWNTDLHGCSNSAAQA